MADASANIQTFTSVLRPYMYVFYVSFGVTLILTPIMRALAQRHGVVDDPDGTRKVHSQPIAYLGGVATFLGWLAGVSVSAVLAPHNASTTFATYPEVPPGVILGAACVVLFGLLDDIYSLTPRLKLFGQFLAAAFLIVPGLFKIGNDYFVVGADGHQVGAAYMVLGALSRFGAVAHDMPAWVPHVAGAFSAIFAVVVIIGACNATNLLDGLDGLCSGVTAVMSAGYLILAVHLAMQATGEGSSVDPTRITLSLALLGAVLGFLPYNFNPASIFMGDTGSMFLGYMCGTMMLLFGQDGAFRWFLAAVIIFGLPMLDTLLAIIRRKLNGRPVFSPDSNHFHHFLIRRGFTVRKAVLLSYAIAAVFVSFALVIVIIPTMVALGLYLVLFGWLVVAAFKIGMIFQQKAPQNTTLNAAVLGGSPQVVATAAPVVPSSAMAQPVGPELVGTPGR